MYHFPSQHNVLKDYQHCSNLFGSSTVESINQLKPLAVPVSSIPVTLEAPQGANVIQNSAEKKKSKVKAKEKSASGKKAVVDTSQFTVEQRVLAAAWVHERLHTQTSMGQIKQQFAERFGRPAPAKNTLLVWERKLFSSGSVHDAPRAGRPARRELLADELRASLAAAPALSERARAAALRVPRSTLRALLRRPRPPPPPRPGAVKSQQEKPATGNFT